MTTTSREQLTWHRVLSLDELPEGRVKTASAGPHSFALTHFEGRYAALSNRWCGVNLGGADGLYAGRN